MLTKPFMVEIEFAQEPAIKLDGAIEGAFLTVELWDRLCSFILEAETIREIAAGGCTGEFSHYGMATVTPKQSSGVCVYNRITGEWYPGAIFSQSSESDDRVVYLPGADEPWIYVADKDAESVKSGLWVEEFHIQAVG